MASSKKLTSLIAIFCTSQFCRAVKHIAVENFRNVARRQSPSPFRLPSYSSLDNDSSEESSLRRRRVWRRRSKKRRKESERRESESDNLMVRRDQRKMTNLDLPSEDTVSTSRSRCVPGLRITRTANDLIPRSLDYRTYRVVNTSKKYDSNVTCRICKLASRLKV